ncbi:HAD family hydrolase [Enterococcus sp. AZ196]|uniref:HAD family hydrolase n=1 Tax=Enterococcus sp. AZ196 TaxID=2774659 RepID=UPI003D27E035
MKKAVIFDMDGVLIDSEPFYFERRMDYFKEKGIRPGSNKFEDYVGNSEKQTWEILVPKDETKRKQLQRDYLHYKKQNQIDFSKALRSSVSKVLDELLEAGFSLSLASSSPRSEIDQMLSDCKLMDYFSYTISGEEVKESKPNPEIYLVSQEVLKCDDYLAIEDSPLGIAAAKAAGIYTVALQQDFLLDQKAADSIISDLKEILALPQLTR